MTLKGPVKAVARIRRDGAMIDVEWPVPVEFLRAGDQVFSFRVESSEVPDGPPA